MARPARDPGDVRESLTAWLPTKEPGATDVAVSNLVLAADGQSNETMLFDASWVSADGPHDEHLVLRVQPDEYQLFFGMDVFFQWKMMEALAAHSNVPVPALQWQEPDPSVLGSPFYVMHRLEGTVPNRFISPAMRDLTPEERRRVYVNGLEAMAQVHRLDWRDGFAFLDSGRGTPGLDRYLGFVEDWFAWVRDDRSFPEVEAGLRYLRERQPVDATVSVQWGDSRPGNIMYSGDQTVVGVLDWELAALGTPEADLGWWLMFEEVLKAEVDGVALDGALGRDETLATYEQFLGRPIRDMPYFDVLAWTRFGITMHRTVDLEIGSPMEDTMRMFDGFVRQRLVQALDAASG
jgi:aminoglycoside phosphotransferase (APT) family kinase protein